MHLYCYYCSSHVVFPIKLLECPCVMAGGFPWDKKAKRERKVGVMMPFILGSHRLLLCCTVSHADRLGWNCGRGVGPLGAALEAGHHTLENLRMTVSWTSTHDSFNLTSSVRKGNIQILNPFCRGGHEAWNRRVTHQSLEVFKEEIVGKLGENCPP